MDVKEKKENRARFSAFFVERTGMQLMEKKVIVRGKSGRIAATDLWIEKSNSDIEKELRSAFVKLKRA